MNDPFATLDECLLVAGKLMDLASRADLIMCNAFRIVADLDMRRAKAIFYTLDSSPPRQNLLRRVTKALHGKDLQRAVERVCGACDAVHKQRRQLAHSLLMVNVQNGKAVMHNPKNEHHQPITDGYLDALLKDAMQAVSSARKEYFALCQMLGKPPDIFFEHDNAD